MDLNQVVIIVIVVLIGILLVIGVYFSISFLSQKKNKLKADTKFNVNNLVENNSLLEVMSEKPKTLDEKQKKNEMLNSDDSINNSVTYKEVVKKNEPLNPFGVNLSGNNDNKSSIPDVNITSDEGGKFFN